jgi:hypothetical protein
MPPDEDVAGCLVTETGRGQDLLNELMLLLLIAIFFARAQHSLFGGIIP